MTTISNHETIREMHESNMITIKCLSWFDHELESICFNTANQKYYLMLVVDFTPLSIDSIEKYHKHYVQAWNVESEIDCDRVVKLYAEATIEELITVTFKPRLTRDIFLKSPKTWLYLAKDTYAEIDIKSIDKSLPLPVLDTKPTNKSSQESNSCHRVSVCLNTESTDVFTRLVEDLPYEESNSQIIIDDKPITCVMANNDFNFCITTSESPLEVRIYFENLENKDMLEKVALSLMFSKIRTQFSRLNISKSDFDSLCDNIISRLEHQ